MSAEWIVWWVGAAMWFLSGLFCWWSAVRAARAVHAAIGGLLATQAAARNVTDEHARRLAALERLARDVETAAEAPRRPHNP